MGAGGSVYTSSDRHDAATRRENGTHDDESDDQDCVARHVSWKERASEGWSEPSSSLDSSCSFAPPDLYSLLHVIYSIP